VCWAFSGLVQLGCGSTAGALSPRLKIAYWQKPLPIPRHHVTWTPKPANTKTAEAKSASALPIQSLPMQRMENESLPMQRAPMQRMQNESLSMQSMARAQ
jgi:hypothetical protein